MPPFPPWFAAHMDALAVVFFSVSWTVLVFFSGWSEGYAVAARRARFLYGAAFRDPKTGRFVGRLL